MAKNLNVLLVFDSPFDAPSGYDFRDELKHPDWSAENKIQKTLRELGHEVRLLGLSTKIEPLLEEIATHRPDVVFNATEVFKQKVRFDKNIAWLLDLLEVPYTGASPADLLICNNKALSKKILCYHRIHVPQFQSFYRHLPPRIAKKLKLPCVVKPLSEEASRGISQASVVDSSEALLERVRFIHESMKCDAIAEEYIEGREFYVGIIGDRRVQALPLREMSFGKLPEDEPRIATYKAKWDNDYRKKWQIEFKPADTLDPAIVKNAQDTCKRAYKALNMRCYARFDIRITPKGMVYIIEPNANPNLQPNDEFVLAAKKAGISYEKLLDRLINLALQNRN